MKGTGSIRNFGGNRWCFSCLKRQCTSAILGESEREIIGRIPEKEDGKRGANCGRGIEEVQSKFQKR